MRPTCVRPDCLKTKVARRGEFVGYCSTHARNAYYHKYEKGRDDIKIKAKRRSRKHYLQNKSTAFKKTAARRAAARQSKVTYLSLKYSAMLSRVRGHAGRRKSHLYKGLPICSKEEFFTWSLSSAEFNALFKQWQANNFMRILNPTVDRVNSDKGYTLDNIEWVTHSENSRRGALSNWYGKAI